MRLMVIVATVALLMGAGLFLGSLGKPSRAVGLTPVATLEQNARGAAEASPPLGLTMREEMPHAAAALARLIDTFLFDGRLPTAMKAAMGLRVAQVTDSPYLGLQSTRLLRSTEEGRTLLAAMRDDETPPLSRRDALAVSYAETLSRDVNGVRDAAFREVRAHFNDSEIVELTMTAAFFNFMARYAAALRPPLDPWLARTNDAPASGSGAEGARIALLLDEEISAAAAAATAARNPEVQRAGLGLGLANSQRAMLRVPALAAAWRAVGNAAREGEVVGRDIKLQVSLAVSMTNGCRYCTLHQIVGLRRLGIDPARLVALKKDDAALTPRELVAVSFARKLTVSPAQVGDQDVEALVREFGRRGALEVILQTCTFAFMNRFTDGLRLPSEDEAIRIYQDVYGATTE